MMFLLIVTIVSMSIAILMSVVAWRMAAEERRRSEARVEHLAAEIHGTTVRADHPADRAPMWHAPEDPADEFERTPERPLAAEPMFAIASPAAAGSRLVTIVAVGAVVFGTGLTVAIMLGGGFRTASHRATARVEKPAAPAAPALEQASGVPLELVALGHDRVGETLTIRGIVRNPSTGGKVDQLTAVVIVYNRDGGFAGSGRATVESNALRPGEDSTFVVTVPDTGDIGRYRVSFRAEDKVVPHVDRREPQTLAKS